VDESAAPRRSRGTTATALFLAGVILGGLSGGAVAVVVEGRAPAALLSASPSPTAAPSAVPTVLPTPMPVVVPSGADYVADVVKELLPSVVTVLNRLPNGQAQSSGSGFVIDARQGYVVTNAHVVENVRGSGVGASFDVIFSDNKTVSATLVGEDALTDVAVLRVPAQGLVAAPLADSDAAPVGASVIAIGSPLGEYQNTVTSGVVSAKGRRVQESADVFLEDLVQTDAAINPGNSGGPLIWVGAKQVIGMNTLVEVNPQTDTQATGLGFAISSNTIRSIASELIAKGRIVRGFIGIRYQPLTPRQAIAAGLENGITGVLLLEIVSGSPAAQAGLRPNDVITKIDDRQIDAQNPLLSVMRTYRPGDRVSLTIVRGGQTSVVTLTLGQEQSP